MTKCRVCGTEIIKFFSLGEMPLVNTFRKKKDTKEKKYDLSIGFCPNCYLIQLMKHVSPQEIFEDYIYFSSVSQSVLDHSKKTAEYLSKRLRLTKDSLVIETGSNDGVHLQFYKKKGIRVLGIDPAKNIAKIANEKGIKTLPEFFNLKLAKRLAGENAIKADVLYGANVFAHVPEIIDFVKGVKIILNSKGTAVFEFPYLKGLLENKFDTVYHEHVFYYSLIALQNLFERVSLEIYDVEFVNMQGGSLRIFVSHQDVYKISSRVINLADTEKKEKFNKITTYKRMNIQVRKIKKDMDKLFMELKKKKKNIAGYGAPAKGIILINHFDMSKYLDFIVDKSKAKQGLYIPGTNIQVLPIEEIMKRKPDYVFILCWNIKDEIIQQLNLYKKSGGKFIIPIPDLTIY